MTELWEKRPQPRGGAGWCPRCHFGTFANWYTLVVSKARQAGLILEEVHSLRMIVGDSLRARQLLCCYALDFPFLIVFGPATVCIRFALFVANGFSFHERRRRRVRRS